MPRLVFAAALVLFIIAAASREARAEIVFLRDGRIIEGKILADSPSEVTIRQTNGATSTHRRGGVLRILYTKVYMGKLYIHKTDGKVLEAYIVDEDQDSYTIRTDINSPKEIVIPRGDVLFMARKNPSALKEKVSLRHVDLNWLAPFNPIKRYNIYVRARGKEYRLDGTSLFTKYRVTGLSCNATYSVYVTAIDRDNYESLPSNEIHFTTLKGDAEPPSRVRISVDRKEKDKPFAAHITWERAKDPCGGAITNYRIYRKTVKGYNLVGATNNTEWQMRNLSPLEKHSFVLRSVDDRGVESAISGRVATDLIPAFSITARAAWLLPIRNYGRLYSQGCGGLVTCTAENLFTRWLDLGAETGFLYLFGKKKNVKYAFMVPFMATAGCRIPLKPWAFMVPRVAFGGAYDRVQYVPQLIGPAYLIMDPPEKSRGSVQMVFSAGLHCSFTVKERVLIQAGADYRGIIEKEMIMDFVSFSAGAGVTF